jgi:hypothetical protein
MAQPAFEDGAFVDPVDVIDGWLNGETVQIPIADVTRRDGGYDNENETQTFVEYYLGDVLVHRSVDLRLKTAIFADGIQAAF